jgi:predicted Fe-S protein YdhL (DUF1289 family)
VCTIDDDTGWCRGCARSLSEIAAWASLPDDTKRAVWAQLPQRSTAMADRYVGPRFPGPSEAA